MVEFNAEDIQRFNQASLYSDVLVFPDRGGQVANQVLRPPYKRTFLEYLLTVFVLDVVHFQLPMQIPRFN